MPCNHVERRVLLRALEELAAQLVHNFPRRLLDFIFGLRMQEVSWIGEAVRAERSQLG